MDSELCNELEWVPYATIKAAGDTNRFISTVVPQLEKGLADRVRFESEFLKDGDGKWTIENPALAPMTAKYRRAVLDKLKLGELCGVFNIGDRSCVYAAISGGNDVIEMTVYVDRYERGDSQGIRTGGHLDEEWDKAVSFQVGYLQSLGFNVDFSMVEDPKVVRAKSTEGELIFLD